MSSKDFEAPLLNATKIVAELEEKISKSVKTLEEDTMIDITDDTEVTPKKRLKQDYEESKLMKELLLDKSIEDPEEIREIYISVSLLYSYKCSTQFALAFIPKVYSFTKFFAIALEQNYSFIVYMWDNNKLFVS